MNTRRGFIELGAAFSLVSVANASFIGSAKGAFWLLFAGRIAARSVLRSGLRSASRRAVSKSLRRGARNRSSNRRARAARKWSDTIIKLSGNISLMNVEISPGIYYEVPEQAPIWGVRSESNIIDMDVSCEAVNEEFLPVKFRVIDLDSGEFEDESNIAIRLPGRPFKDTFQVPRPLRHVEPGRKLIYGSVPREFENRVQIKPEPIVVVI